MQTPTKKLIRSIYLYLVSFVALMMIVIPTGQLINLILKTYIFTQAQDYYLDMSKPMSCDSQTIMFNKDIKPLTAEECAKLEKQQKQQAEERKISDRDRDFAENISFLVVSVPLFIIHWMYARKKEE